MGQEASLHDMNTKFAWPYNATVETRRPIRIPYRADIRHLNGAHR